MTLAAKSPQRLTSGPVLAFGGLGFAPGPGLAFGGPTLVLNGISGQMALSDSMALVATN